MGSVAHGIGDELGDGTVARDIVARMGGTSALEEAFIAVAFTMMGMVAAAFAVSLTLRLHQEESGQRAETTLAGAVSRTRWLASHLVAALARVRGGDAGLPAWRADSSTASRPATSAASWPWSSAPRPYSCPPSGCCPP